VRNKPIEPPKKPEKAPFFLPSVPTLSGEILFEPPASLEADGSNADDTSHKTMADLSSHFSRLLQSCEELKNCKYLWLSKTPNKYSGSLSIDETVRSCNLHHGNL
jgi:hypothetical protein